MISSVATKILLGAIAVVSVLQGAAAQYGMYGMYDDGMASYGYGYGEDGMAGGARRLQQDMGSYGEYGYGSSSYGYGEPAAYGEGASIDYATEPIGGRRLLQDMGSYGYGAYSYGYGEASYGYGK